MEVKELLKYIINYLLKINVKQFENSDLYKIVEYVFKIDINKLYNPTCVVSINTYKLCKLRRALKDYYIKKIPLQYIIKKQKFFMEEYYVNQNVLIPRYDTELLVEKAIEYIDKYKLSNVLDMCTGSGCIGVSIAKNSNVSSVLMCDISKDALKVAYKNIRINNGQNKCKLINSDLFYNIDKSNKFSLIVSNPPYIKTRDILLLDEYVKKEPYIALFGGNSGIKFYEEILEEAINYLYDDAYIMFEIGYDELDDIKKLVSNYRCYDIIECVKDYSNNDRVVVCHFHQK